MRWLWLVLLVPLVVVLTITATYLTVPTRTTDATHFDTLIVLGCPAMLNGTASLEGRERVLEAVREYQAGRASHMIVSGAAAHNFFVEADVFAQLAIANGVPASAIEEETQAKNTIQNIFYSEQIMRKHGWTSAEVISSPNHLPRSGLILEHWQFKWRTHAARWPPEYDWQRIAQEDIREAVGTTELRWFGFSASPYLPER